MTWLLILFAAGALFMAATATRILRELREAADDVEFIEDAYFWEAVRVSA